MRTFNELLTDAVAQTERLMQEDKDPAEAAFLVTEDERSLLKRQPIDPVTLNLERDRFCGMKITVISSIEGGMSIPAFPVPTYKDTAGVTFAQSESKEV